MKANIWSTVAITLLVTGLAACSANTPHGVEQSGVILSITDFDELPVQVSVNGIVETGGLLPVGQLILQNIAANPTGTTSALMNVEIERYEVGFTRADKGTRTPQPTVRAIFGSVPVNGTLTFDNLPVMTAEEFTNPPLSDLLFQNGGVDKETGSEAILLNLELKFYGRTLASNTLVETATPARWTIQFVP